MHHIPEIIVVPLISAFLGAIIVPVVLYIEYGNIWAIVVGVPVGIVLGPFGLLIMGLFFGLIGLLFLAALKGVKGVKRVLRLGVGGQGPPEDSE